MTADPIEAIAAPSETYEFSLIGYVIRRAERREVYVGGSLVGWFESQDIAMRNILLVAASRAMGVDMRKLAKAFGISPAMGRNIRRRYRQQGLQAIVEHKRGGRERKLTAKLQTRLNKLFEKGLMIDEAHEKIRRNVSRTLVGRAHKHWIDAKKAADDAQLQCVTSSGMSAPAQEAKLPNAGALSDDAAEVVVARERRAPKHSVVVTGPIADRESPKKERGDDASREPSRLLPLITEGEQPVQHLGCWMMLAMLNALGIYAYAEVLRHKTQLELVVDGKRVMKAETLRLAIDAVAIALTLRQKTVEGVRRIATTSSMILLRLGRAGPLSASWVRRILGSFAAQNSDLFRMALATTLVQQSERHAAEAMRVVFYIDNHMRPYTGKFKIRKGWRMQSKRAVPGNADFWVHDADGRPVMRVDSPGHESLVQWLRPIGRLIREALNDENVVIVLVFDRAGAYAQELAELRDEGFEFATYERKPCAKLSASVIQQQITLHGESYGLAEMGRKNLGKGRGRVRRVVLKTPEGKQVNVLAVSKASAEQVVHYMTRRWACQENQFKHGVERWGINQLDGRSVEPYPSDSVIPNPARSRVERALRLARTVEGEALRRLQHLGANDPQRERLQKDLERARRQQNELQELRPFVPTHAPVKDTELFGELVRHKQCYKHTVDAIRIGLANAESELAARLGPMLPRQAEAKRTLSNLLCAPGTITENRDAITITLSPAGTSSEQRAFQRFLAELSELPLSLPGDPGQRQLRFQALAQ
jgi:hypothetical protein